MGPGSLELRMGIRVCEFILFEREGGKRVLEVILKMGVCGGVYVVRMVAEKRREVGEFWMFCMERKE